MHQQAEAKPAAPRIGKVNEKDGTVEWRDLTSTEKAMFELYQLASADWMRATRAYRTSNRRFWASVVCNVVLLGVLWFR